MVIQPDTFLSTVRTLLEREGTVVTDVELTRLAAQYPRCGGKDDWGVREYARFSGLGAREYRVVRGGSVQDVYCSAVLANAVAVRTALNELESRAPAKPIA